MRKLLLSIAVSLVAISALVVAVISSTQKASASVALVAQSTFGDDQISIDFDRLSVPLAIRPAITSAVLSRPDRLLPARDFAVVSLRLGKDWGLATLGVTDNLLEDIAMGDNGAFVILRLTGDNGWMASLEGSTKFYDLLAQMPDDVLTPNAKQSLSAPRPSTQSPLIADMRFPWDSSQSWTLTQGWHLGNSVDFAPAISEPNKWVLAAHGGTVTRFCQGTLASSFQIVHSDGTTTQYLHIDNNSISSSILGTFISQGQLLGKAYNGAYSSDGCGYSSGPHVHFVLPSQNVTVDGWIAHSDNTWTKGSETKWIGSWFNSSNVKSEGTCTAPTNGNPRDGATRNTRTVDLTWSSPSSCSGLDVYTIRAVRDQSKIDSGPWVKDFGIDAPATSTSPTFDSDGDYYWAVWPCRGCKSGNPNYGQRSDVYHFRIDTGAGGNDGVELCDGTNFGSPCKIFTVGKYNLRDFGWESRADSARYRGSYVTNYHAVLYPDLIDQNGTPHGTPVHMDQTNYPDLGQWKNAIKSIEIYYNPPTPLPQPPILQSPDNGATFNEGNSIALSWSATGNEYYGEVWGGPAGTSTFGWQSGTSNNMGATLEL